MPTYNIHPFAEPKEVRIEGTVDGKIIETAYSVGGAKVVKVEVPLSPAGKATFWFPANFIAEERENKMRRAVLTDVRVWTATPGAPKRLLRLSRDIPPWGRSGDEVEVAEEWQRGGTVVYYTCVREFKRGNGELQRAHCVVYPEEAANVSAAPTEVHST